MPATIYYDNDADLSALKDKTIAILGYGSQGHAQAQNLRDSGLNVIVGQRPGSPNYELAVSHGFEPKSAAEAVLMFTLSKSYPLQVLMPCSLHQRAPAILYAANSRKVVAFHA